MNCEKCTDLISDFLDGSMSQQDRSTLSQHLEECLGCADIRNDLNSIVSYCRENRGVYEAPPNERAMWLRIRNVIEAENLATDASLEPHPRMSWFQRTWELSIPQLAALAAAIILVVSLSTIVGVRRWQSSGQPTTTLTADNVTAADSVRSRIARQQQAIDYWNQRVEFNKSRWEPEMRETFDRNLKVIDEAVNTSFDSLTRNPHDEVSEEMLNAALNEKLALLKEFGDL